MPLAISSVCARAQRAGPAPCVRSRVCPCRTHTAAPSTLCYRRPIPSRRAGVCCKLCSCRSRSWTTATGCSQQHPPGHTVPLWCYCFLRAHEPTLGPTDHLERPGPPGSSWASHGLPLPGRLPLPLASRAASRCSPGASVACFVVG